jgi:XTP/dITP diphosphohydrolase
MIQSLPLISQITLATTNQGKIAEFEHAFSEENISFKGLPSGFNCPETANSFLGNAFLKAQMCSKQATNYALADDSGLCITALNEEPGIYSARYFQEGEGLKKILQRLTSCSNRQAYFVCALVLTSPEGQIIWQTEQKWYGKIAQAPAGKGGFGYDPIFIPDGSAGLTVAEMEPAHKEQQSHRGQAINELKKFLQSASNQAR